jgi:hypothetical protein
VDDNQAFEHNRPSRVPQAVWQGSKDLGNTSVAGLCGDEDVLDIFRLWRSKLNKIVSDRTILDSSAASTLILVPPLTDFSNEADDISTRCCYLSVEVQVPGSRGAEFRPRQPNSVRDKMLKL